jgi:hypothetical protein
MTDRKRKTTTKARETLRNAKRNGMRVYPAFADVECNFEDEVRGSLGDGNFVTLPKLSD